MYCVKIFPKFENRGNEIYRLKSGLFTFLFLVRLFFFKFQAVREAITRLLVKRNLSATNAELVIEFKAGIQLDNSAAEAPRDRLCPGS